MGLTSVKSQSLPFHYCMVGSKAGLSCLLHSLASEAIQALPCRTVCSVTLTVLGIVA